ncbi:MAG TPA: polysaccharide biosynthesis C-terminal domain-containing protein [Pseudolabrys sp.]|nr:polysaccharide biosynthesis C-terminal domain-containing protein [Pseudolabrys sp.]
MTLVDIVRARAAAPGSAVAGLWRQLAQFISGEHSTTKKLAGAVFAIRVLSAVIAFVTQVLIARWIGSYEFGSFVYVWTWLLLASDVVHLGLPLTAQRFIPEYTQTQAFGRLRGYLDGSRWLTFGAGTVVALGGAAIVVSLGDRIGSHLILPFYFAAAALPFYALTFMHDGLARSYNWIDVALLPAYVIRPLIFFAAIFGLHFGGFALNATTAMGALAFAGWLAALLQLVQFNRRLKTVVEPGRKSYDLRRWLGTAFPIILVWGLYTLLTSIDVLLLKQFRPEEEVAHYYAAAKILALVSFIYFAVAATTAHRYTDYHVAGDHEGLAYFAASTVRWVFWPSLALCSFIIVFGYPLLRLFGPDFVAGYPVIVILAVGQLARAAVGPAERMLNVLGYQRACAIAYAAAFAFDIVACLLLAPPFGALGAAAATAGAFLVESVCLFLIAKRGLGLHMFIWHPRKPKRAAHMVN